METLSNSQLIERLSDVVQADRRNSVKMLRYVSEIDQRKAWAEHACSSMFAFLVQRFQMSEDEAYKRLGAARAARSYPVVFDMVERGDLHLTAVVMLARHLTAENHVQLLGRAKHKTKRQIEELIAEHAPQPDRPTRIRALRVDVGDKPEGESCLAPLGENTNPAFQLVPEPVAAMVKPLAPKRYHLSLTVSEHAREALRKLKDISRKDETVLIEEALELLLERKLKQKAAITPQPRPRRSTGQARTIPAAIRRDVFARDAGRWAFIDALGNRCIETRNVEFHHIRAWARGGEHSVENVALRCRAHNLFEAERDYGPAFIKNKVDGVRESISP